MKSRPFRQGDVLLVLVDSIPGETRKLARNRGRIVLAEGEATGHAHAIADAASTWRYPDGSLVFERPEDYVLAAEA